MYVQGPRLLPVWNLMLAMFQDPNLGTMLVSFDLASLYLMAGAGSTRAATVIKDAPTARPNCAYVTLISQSKCCTSELTSTGFEDAFKPSTAFPSPTIDSAFAHGCRQAKVIIAWVCSGLKRRLIVWPGRTTQTSAGR